jgi:hypothetical protein
MHYLPAGSRIGPLSDTSLECYRCTNLLDSAY